MEKLASYKKTGRPVDAFKLTVFANWWLNRKTAMFEPTCLKRCLVVYKYLDRAGMPVKMFYGIKKNAQGDNEGHSWLTLDGVPLWPDGDTAGEYKVTFSYPPDKMNK